ncbi:MAG: amidohydrolase family protein [Amylibacter sp.]|jgi:cytosine deaminase|nr:MAG: cytosine deaminase [Paracoccaceae bacterium]|tara:strand:- start:1066 stop:2355 length:1290 start_codon:yes stop_codon:yes gene_type:complete
MDVDLIIKNANLSNDQTGVDIACKDGVIISIERGINANAKKTIDAQGHLVSPPFVDPHFHMDATLSLGTPRMNVSGTLLEGISLWSELKPIQNVEQIIDRALRYCDLAVSMGIGAIRSHVDICDNSLKGVEALLEVQRKVAPYIELQLVAFPQDGIFRDPNAKVNLINALDMGVNVVGGIPHFERTMQDGADSVKFLCEIAAERGLMVDMHCDESDDPQSRHIETLAFETSRLGLHGRVAGSHLTSMHSMDNYYVSKLIPLMAEAEIHAIPNPLINIMLQGRHDSYPKRRGQTRVPELKNAGINVGFGSDCVMDPWYSLGKADMLDVAHMGLHVGQLSSRLDMEWCFDAVTLNSANIMGLEGYGLKRGCKADMVILQANDKIDAIRLRANRLFVIRAGKVISTTKPIHAELDLSERPKKLDPSEYIPKT